MDESQYDEYGNFIGVVSDDEEDESVEAGETQFAGETPNPAASEVGTHASVNPVIMEAKNAAPERQIVLHEDKQYYPEAEEIYGSETIVMVQEEDTQPITEPIIPPAKVYDFDLLEKSVPGTTFSFDFLAGLMGNPQLVRNVCVVGDLSCGKTTLIDMLVRETHDFTKELNNSDKRKVGKAHKERNLIDFTRELRYLDSRRDEAERGLSIKSSPISLVLPDSQNKSYLLNLMDTPGHPNFQDEVVAAARVADGVVICVDVIMGVTKHLERMLHHCVKEELDITLCVTKIDRLVLELKQLPKDAYFKMKHTIDSVNTCLLNIHNALGIPEKRKWLSPTKGNVIFASAQFNMIFSLKSFAQIYSESYGDAFDPEEIYPLFWGNVYFNQKRRKFQREQPPANEDDPEAEAPARTFVEFILKPLYKLIGYTVSSEKEDLREILSQVGIYLTKKEYDMSTKDMLKLVGHQMFGGSYALMDSLVEFVRSPQEMAQTRIPKIYTGDMDGEIASDLMNMDPKGDLVVHTVKNYHHPDLSTFDVLGRVMSGTLYKGDKVKVFGENYSMADDEDQTTRIAQTLWIPQGRYRVEISHVPAGNWVLISGVESNIVKTATIIKADNDKEVEIFRPLKFETQPSAKVAIEPLNPSELPKMVAGLRKLDKSYPICKTKVEESGEHVISGTGELYLDCLLHDLRRLYGDLEVKVSDPIVTFAETVSESSSIKCFAETANRHNRLYMLADPLEDVIVDDIEKGRIVENWSVESKPMRDHFKQQYNWDILATKGIWAFGPTNRGPNMLLNDSLPEDVDERLLNACKDSIVQGFQWATREGPLCDELIRGTKFKLLDAKLHDKAEMRGGGQIIPAARRAVYSSFLTAAPRLLEPVYMAEIVCPADCVEGVYSVLNRRRGHVNKDYPKVGSPLYIVEAYIPVIECYGFETDVRSHTSGAAMVMTWFDHWKLVPGDPLDRGIILRPLEPAPIPHLAREFMLKTRRRKGLAEDVNISKYLDQENYLAYSADVMEF